ncbi:MAG TPA: DUF1272 domain-containing protein [Solirubrobacteraceae bacterium]|nr:DUF1272 domain-containing protein [Solirubrobacteraceae bacterium]
MLEMKPRCERCGEELGHGSAAMICSYECTYCLDCATEFERQCPNRHGELVARPTRSSQAATA